jgi:hypothetical protein
VLGPTETPFQTDLVNTLEIALVGGGAPESVSAEEMLAGANRAAVIRADGTAEIIHFQDVTATDAVTYMLSTLLRGRRGTEVFVPGHEPGEMFVEPRMREQIDQRIGAGECALHALRADDAGCRGHHAVRSVARLARSLGGGKRGIGLPGRSARTLARTRSGPR